MHGVTVMVFVRIGPSTFENCTGGGIVIWGLPCVHTVSG
jgi:hypothetical protein